MITSDPREKSKSPFATRYRDHGIVGLVDRRKETAATSYTSIDVRWRDAFTAVLDANILRSRINDNHIIDQVRREVAARFPENPPNDLSDRQLLRYLEVLATGRGLRLSKKSQASIANRPSRSSGWRPVMPSRAGQIVAIDTNKLDVFALDPVTAQWQQLHLLLALDLYTRSIVGWRFTAWTPTSQDVRLLLRHIVSPKLAADHWPAEGLWRYMGVPETLMAGLLDADPLHDRDHALDGEERRIAGVPVVVPDAIALDNGTDYKSADVRDACQLLGVNLEFGRPYTPTDKSHVERVFKTIADGFLQRLPGYKGPDVFSRGNRKYVEDAAFFTIDEIEERFAAWVAIEYQNAPHDRLRHPSLPTVTLSPNQMMDLSISHAGFIPVPVDKHLQIELLTTVWLTVTKTGLQYKNLIYDFREACFLDDYRGRPSPFADHDRKWRVKVDRRDLSRVWFFAFDNPLEPEPGAGQWLSVPLRDLPEALPFQERHLAHAKRILANNGGDNRDRTAVVRQLRILMGRVYDLDDDTLTTAEKRLAAHAAAHENASAKRRATVASVTSDHMDDDHDLWVEDEDAPPTEINQTTTRQPNREPVASTDIEDLPEALPYDELEEWDPFEDADTA